VLEHAEQSCPVDPIGTGEFFPERAFEPVDALRARAPQLHHAGEPHFGEGVVHGELEVVRGAGDLHRAGLFVEQQVIHRFRPRVDAEQGAQTQAQVGRSVRVEKLSVFAQFDVLPLQAEAGEDWIGFADNRDRLAVGREEQRFWLAGLATMNRRQTLPLYPATLGRAKVLADGGQYAPACEFFIMKQVLKPLHINEPFVQDQPAQHFIEHACVVPAQRASQQQQGFGINHRARFTPAMTRHAECAPLRPQSVEHRLEELVLNVWKRVSHVRVA